MLDKDGLTATEPGRLMAHFYIRLKTMIAIIQVPGHASISDLLMVIAKSSECSHIKLRRGEKKVLNSLNKELSQDKLDHCIIDDHKAGKAKERIGSGPEKVYIMVSHQQSCPMLPEKYVFQADPGVPLQVSSALSGQQSEQLDYSMKQELERVRTYCYPPTACLQPKRSHAGVMSATMQSYIW